MLARSRTSAVSIELSNLSFFLSGNRCDTTASPGSGDAGYMSSSWGGNGKCLIQLFPTVHGERAQWMCVQGMSSVSSNARAVPKGSLHAKPVILHDPSSTRGNEASICQLERAKESLGGRRPLA